MKSLQKFAALMLITLVPSLALFLILAAFGMPWPVAAIIASGLLGLGLDVCVRGR